MKVVERNGDERNGDERNGDERINDYQKVSIYR